MVLVAVRLGLLVQVTGLVAALLLLVAGLKNPVWLLFAYVALIPLEDAFQVTGFGTLTKGVGVVFAFCYLARSLRSVRLGVITWAGWAWFGWIVLSVMWALNAEVAVTTLTNFMQQLLMVLLIANVVASEQSLILPLLKTYTAAATIASILAVIGYLTQASFLGPVRVQAFDGQDQAQFATSVVPAVVFGFYYLTKGGTRLGRILMAPALVVALLAVLMSGTRSAWLGLILGAVLFLAQQARQKGFLLALVLGGGMLALTSTIPFLREFVTSRTVNAIESGGSGRLDIWLVGLTIAAEHLAVGVGIGNFPQAFTFEAIARTAQASWQSAALYAGRGAHNIYLASLVETGLVGFVLFASFLWQLLKRHTVGTVGSLIQAMSVTYIIQGMFLDITNRKYFWLVMALAAGVSYAGRVQGPPRSGEAST